jgi:hypothetical protein
VRLAASGSFDGLVRLWDVKSGRHLVTLLGVPADDASGDWLALAPEGYLLASAGLRTSAEWWTAGRRVPTARVWEALSNPAAVAKTLRGEKVPVPRFGK